MRLYHARCFDRGIDPLRFRLLLLIAACALVAALSASRGSSAEEPQAPALPAWLKAHVGEGDGQIAPVVLARARALYAQKTRAGVVKNPCYFAMDATRPGGLVPRFYIICEAARTFSAVPTGHGNGRNLAGIANFANGITCAKNFSNATDSKLTTGGPYVTGEERDSFKGYYGPTGGKQTPLIRSFVQFDGEGEAANARARAIGGHPAVVLRVMCRRKNPDSPYADADGYVPSGTLVNYAGGRSNGCTTWSPSDAAKIIGLIKDNPATLYIYPEAGDIDAVAKAVKAGKSPARAGLYWNPSCLSEIGAPKFWPKETLEPILAEYKKNHPAPPPSPLPICK